jgi:YgiT-type zinc finger domain-containing protein
MNKVCPVCESNNTEVIVQTEIFEYKDRKIEVPEYQKTVCNTCGESIAAMESVNGSIPILRDAKRVIDGGFKL